MVIGKKTWIQDIGKYVRFWPCYLLALISIAVIKYRYSSVDVELLGWILAPTAWWAGILTGEPFPWQAGIGYVSGCYQFVIANTCSGIQFLMIVIAALVFGFVHRMGTPGKGLLWTAGSVVFSYGFTIFVNGVRIACAIFLPRRLPPGFLERFLGGWLTPDRLHTVIGILVYFVSLLFIYEMAGTVVQRMGMAEQAAERPQNAGIWVPVFWYFFVVLGIPFLNQAYERRPEAFTEYAITVGIVCPGVLAVRWVLKKMHFL